MRRSIQSGVEFIAAVLLHLTRNAAIELAAIAAT
jgi:hypothetical protein